MFIVYAVFSAMKEAGPDISDGDWAHSQRLWLFMKTAPSNAAALRQTIHGTRHHFCLGTYNTLGLMMV
jgi:hypothetical protein